LLATALLSLVISGYYGISKIKELSRTTETAKDVREFLQIWGLKSDTNAQEQLEIALSMLKNDTCDPKPILIAAVLGTLPETGQAAIGLISFDEDSDIMGFGIKEEITDMDGSDEEILEEYPAFVHRHPFENIDFPWVPVKIRDAAQRKAAQQWEEYVSGDVIDKSKILRATYWRATLPDIFVSVPHPYKVEVELYLYDASGHQSKPVKLHFMSGHFPEQGQENSDNGA